MTRSSRSGGALSRSRGRIAAVMAGMLVGALGVVATGGPASAINVAYNCTAYDPVSDTVLAEGITLPVDMDVSAPASAEPNTEMTVTVPARSQPVPTTLDINGTTYNVAYVENLFYRISIGGGTVVAGSAAKTDPSAPGTVSTNTTNNWFQMAYPLTAGTVAGGQTVEWPAATFRVLTGADGTQTRLTARSGTIEADHQLTLAVLGGAVTTRLRCTAPFNTLSTTSVADTTTTTEAPTTTTTPPLAKPNISIGDASIVEGSAGRARHVKFSVTLTANNPLEVTAEYTITDGSATGSKRPDLGVDYRNAGVTKTITFPVRSNGTTAVRRVISVPVYPDTDIEGDETITVTLANPTGGVSLGRPTATGTIIDDDPGSGPALAIGDASIGEGDADKRVAQLGLTLSEPVTEEILVDYVVVGDTATCAKAVYGTVPTGTDCNDLAGKVRTARFRPSLVTGFTQVYRAIAVQLFADLDTEGDETVTVALSNARPANVGSPLTIDISRSVGTITLLDDD